MAPNTPLRPSFALTLAASLLSLCALSACEKPAGEPCEERDDCQPGLVCAHGICAHLHREGEDCDKDSECVAGLVCLDEVCFERRRVASGCDKSEQCEEGLTCHGGTCISEANIKRGEKQRKVKSQRTLRDIFSSKFSKKLDALGDAINAEGAAWSTDPGAEKAREHFEGCVMSYRIVVAAVGEGKFDTVPAHIAAAGVHLAPMLSVAEAAHPRLTSEMKTAMTDHEDVLFGRLQRQQQANRKFIKQLKDLAKATNRGMQACLRTGPPEARVAALKHGVALRDGVRRGAEGKVAKAYAAGIKKLAYDTASKEPYAAIKAEMKKVLVGDVVEEE